MRGFVRALFGAAAFLASTALADVDPIVIKGSKFFYKSNGTEFFIKGVAYQQDYSGNGTTTGGSNSYKDPLADTNGCSRDIPYLTQLSTNTIRVYAVDPTQNHDQCMQMLSDAGIYVILDLSQPGLSINRETPAWNQALYARYTSVVDAFAKYNNVLGFFAGNEVSNNVTNTNAAPFVKAAVRDTKAYIKSKNYRTIGVGYATNDDADIRVNLADYFNCGDPADAIDFWGYNIYSWCSPSSYEASGYKDRTEQFQNYSVPVFFAEYGCNKERPRPFDEVPVLFGPDMSPVWSGGIVYMYFQEANDYGLVSIDGTSASPLPDFTSLSSQIAQVTPSGVTANGYTPTNSPQACPATGSAWNAATALPPTPDENLCSCVVKTLTCVAKPGLSDNTTGQLFGQVCGYNNGAACNGIAANGATGQYGAYGMCSPSDQLSYAFNAYYLSQGSNSQACNFGGDAQTQASAKASGSCASQISAVGTAGTGAASGTGASGTATKKGAAGMVTVPKVQWGMLSLGAYVLAAVMAGAGMILL